MLLKMAFRNIWRNKRQTLLTIAAIFFAVFIACILRSFQKGAWDNVVSSSVNMYYGYLQIHKNGYWDDQNIDNSFETSEELQLKIANIPEIENLAPRLESFALASAKNTTKGVMVIGVDPSAENKLTQLADRVVAGSYLTAESTGVLVAEGLAQKLKLGVSDTLVLISQGYHGVNSAGKYRIDGIVKYPMPELNKKVVYLPLGTAQEFYGASNRVSSFALKLPRENSITKVKTELNKMLDTDVYEFLDFKELMPDLLQARLLDEMGAYLILLVLYCLIGFTLFGTVLMMVNKRSYEFGVLLSIGMQRWKLFTVVFIEIIVQAIVGIVLGIIATLPIAYYFHKNPINMAVVAKDAASAFSNFGVDPVFPFSISPSIFINQSIVVFIILLLLSIYPILNIFKLKPVQAMRE